MDLKLLFAPELLQEWYPQITKELLEMFEEHEYAIEQGYRVIGEDRNIIYQQFVILVALCVCDPVRETIVKNSDEELGKHFIEMLDVSMMQFQRHVGEYKEMTILEFVTAMKENLFQL